MSPKVSIIIASFNTENIISFALNSVLNQTFQNWECIVIDGLSNDNTISIVEQYSKRDKRIRYFSEKDFGIYDAFNKGWKRASGEWIYFLGADDILCPTAFHDVFSSNLQNYSIVFGNVIYKSSAGLVYKKSNQDILSIKKRLNCSHQGFLMRRDSIQDNGGFDFMSFKICADYDLILKAYLNGAKMKYINTYIAVFDNTGTSSSIKTEFEGFSIRKSLKTVPYITNCYLFAKEVCLNRLRNLKCKIFKKNKK